MSEPESGLDPIAVSHDTRLGVSRDVHRNVVADAVVAVAPEPDRSTAAHHAAAVSTGPTTHRTHDRVWTLSATPLNAAERRQTTTDYLYGKD